MLEKVLIGGRSCQKTATEKLNGSNLQQIFYPGEFELEYHTNSVVIRAVSFCAVFTHVWLDDMYGAFSPHSAYLIHRLDDYNATLILNDSMTISYWFSGMRVGVTENGRVY